MTNTQTKIAFCENGDCRVLLYQIGEDDSAEHYLKRDPSGFSNCPGCGRFGRLKDESNTPEFEDREAPEQPNVPDTP